MRKIFFLFFLVLTGIKLSAQSPIPPPPAKGDSTTLTYAEVMPQFPGPGSFTQYLASHVKYPIIEKESGKQGTVYIKFIVEKDGSITNIHPVKEVPGAPGFTKEGIRVLSGMPNWKPGMIDGHPVRVEFTQPIKFVLDGGVSPEVIVRPSFPGGDSALANYIRQNLVYPKKEKKHHKEGTVVLSFWVGTDGSISGITIISEVPHAPGLTKEAKRLIAAMPEWIPGTRNGTAQTMYAEVKVEFKL